MSLYTIYLKTLYKYLEGIMELSFIAPILYGEESIVTKQNIQASFTQIHCKSSEKIKSIIGFDRSSHILVLRGGGGERYVTKFSQSFSDNTWILGCVLLILIFV